MWILNGIQVELRICEFNALANIKLLTWGTTFE